MAFRPLDRPFGHPREAPPVGVHCRTAAEERGTRMRRDDADRDKVWFRATRIFHTDDGWYVGTREGNLGPFLDRQLADIELKRYIGELRRQLAHPS